MYLRSVGRLPLGLLWIPFLFAPLGSSQVSARSAVAPALAGLSSCITSSAAPLRAYPVLAIGCGDQLSFAGSYSPDGKYHSAVIPRWYKQDAAPPSSSTARPAAVPAWVDLHSREHVIQNLRPPYHATRQVKGQSRLASIRDSIITFAYGHEQLLLGPHHVVTDSTGRVILTDPVAGAVHVLDGENSFRVSTGTKHRLVKPEGIAVDADDNIYVADSEQSVVVVFDRNGNFLRDIGKLGRNETLFHVPTGIAVDRTSHRLYVLDADRQKLFILDLQGNEIKRIGRYQGNDGIIDFAYPSDIAIGENKLAILDNSGARVWVTDLDGNPQTSFSFPTPLRPAMNDALGITMDANDNIYISNGTDSNVKIYDCHGHLLGAFGRPGENFGEFKNPTGLWIDRQNRIFVADEATRRVQVFQLTAPAPEEMAAGE